MAQAVDFGEEMVARIWVRMTIEFSRSPVTIVRPTRSQSLSPRNTEGFGSHMRQNGGMEGGGL